MNPAEQDPKSTRTRKRKPMVAPTAEDLAKKHKEISVAEFFERNKHILGFDSLNRALLTCVKEGVDNALDVCEEVYTLPDIKASLTKEQNDTFHIVIEDNGPGIIKKQIPQVFGKLLYGSRFHEIRQTRGQQGIGISAAVLYGQLTTGKPARITSKTVSGEAAYMLEIVIDTHRNAPRVVSSNIIVWRDENGELKPSGTRVEVTLKGRYIRGKQSIFEYLRSTAIVNPHAMITLIEPDGTKTIFKRGTEHLPGHAVAIKPHPAGIEIGILMKMLRLTKSPTLQKFLMNEFSRVSKRLAAQILSLSQLKGEIAPRKVKRQGAERIINAISQVSIMEPPTNCLSPIGESLVKKGLRKEITAEFVTSAIRRPLAYSGNPFQVEVGLCYGTGSSDDTANILRFANRVPLLFQQGGCVTTKAVESINWRPYGLEQRGGKGIPRGPVVILIHVASTNIPFTSEAKEAIADIDLIKDEIIRALRICARKMNVHIKRKAKRKVHLAKLNLIEKILPEINQKTSNNLGFPLPDISRVVGEIMDSYMFKSTVSYSDLKKSYEVKIRVSNYTETRKKFKLMAEIAEGALVRNVHPDPLNIEDELIIWEVAGIPSGEGMELSFELVGVPKGDYEECVLYQKGLNERYVFGAEVPPEGGEAENIAVVKT
ncbi:MAG: DNA topoisomerase VI subunit B [Thermoplasmata archaeon]|nr:DNA topoisomerase VI subunit B [Thermoplasmata archaeon]